MAQITVGYERKFSDGNYGSEGLSLTYTVDYDDSQSELAIESAVIDARCRVIAQSLRTAVLSFLSTPGHSERVVWAAKRELNPPLPVTVPSGPKGAPVDMEDIPF